MSFQDVINGELGVNFAKYVAKVMPERLGLSLADFIAKIISKRKFSKMVECVRVNQWVVSGKTLDSKELDKRVELVFDHTAFCLFDLYHNIHDPKTLSDKVTFTPKLQQILEQRKSVKEGTVYVGPHLSNFDLAGRVITYRGFQNLVLSYPNPNKGYELQNELRKEYDIEIVPMSFESLRLAKQRLLEGNSILTGMDRPLETTNYHPLFFGVPSMVPVTYIKLALQTNSPVIAIVCIGNEDGSYTADCSDVIRMKKYNDPVEEMERNTEKVLKQVEKFIKANPSQWSMFYPVWPSEFDNLKF